MADNKETTPATEPAVEKKEETPVEDDEMPALEAAQPAQVPETKQNRAEKKARKAIAKLGLKKVEGINLITVRKQKSPFFKIINPDVYGGGDCYVVFGEPQIYDYKNELANMASAAKQFEQADAAEKKEATEAAAAAPPTEAAPAEEKVDETGLKAEDIDNVIAQSKCTRAAAVAALRKTNGDVVQAILDLQ